MVNHGFSTAALFLRRRLPRSAAAARKRIADFGGWQKVTPVLAGSSSSPACPPGAARACRRSSREFLVLVGHVHALPRPPRVIATLGIVLAALYILLMYQRIDDRPEARAAPPARPATCRAARSGVVAPLHRARSSCSASSRSRCSTCINPAVDRTLQHVGVTDPTPTDRRREGSAK